jgi:uncharacterized radical SAM superfamily Fe-S cluster-containing enzyme
MSEETVITITFISTNYIEGWRESIAFSRVPAIGEDLIVRDDLYEVARVDWDSETGKARIQTKTIGIADAEATKNLKAAGFVKAFESGDGTKMAPTTRT